MELLVVHRLRDRGACAVGGVDFIENLLQIVRQAFHSLAPLLVARCEWRVRYGARPVEYLIKRFSLQQGALEIQYIEEFFLDFPRKKTATEVMQRLGDRDHQILMAEAPLPDDPSTFVPVSFKVAHELRSSESDPKLADLVAQLRTACSSTIGESCTSGLAAPGPTGAVRDISAR